MTKIADFHAFTPELLAELRGVFARFELILGIFGDFQKGMDDIDVSFGEVPFVSVLLLFSESWHQNCLLFNRFLPVSDFHFEEIACQIRSSFEIFTAAEKASSAGLLNVSPGSSSYAFLLQCVCLRCRILLISSRRKLQRMGALLTPPSPPAASRAR